MSQARRRVLTISAAVFIGLIPPVVTLWLTLPQGDSAPEFRDFAPQFIAFMLVVIMQTVCILIYEEEVLRNRKDLARRQAWLLALLILGGAIVAIPVYWWRNVRPSGGAGNREI
jgi:hypothetical protein